MVKSNPLGYPASRSSARARSGSYGNGGMDASQASITSEQNVATGVPTLCITLARIAWRLTA